MKGKGMEDDEEKMKKARCQKGSKGVGGFIFDFLIF